MLYHRTSKGMIRLFEPLVIGAMQTYRQTHDLELQKLILFTLTQLIKFGVCPSLMLPEILIHFEITD